MTPRFDHRLTFAANIVVLAVTVLSLIGATYAFLWSMKSDIALLQANQARIIENIKRLHDEK